MSEEMLTAEESLVDEVEVAQDAPETAEAVDTDAPPVHSLPPLGKPTLDSFLHTIVEQRIPQEAGETLSRLLGSTMPSEDGQYAIAAAGRFNGSRTGDLLAYASKINLSGALVIVESDAERVLYFHEGNLIGAASTVLFEHLGRLLYKAGVVSHEASSTLVDAEEALGGHAMLMWLSTRHLLWAVERRIWEVAAAVHLIKRGHFVFIQGTPDLNCPIVSLDPEAVAAEGARLHDELLEGTGETDEVYHPPSMPPPPPRIERELRPIDVSQETLREILKRISEADPLPEEG